MITRRRYMGGTANRIIEVEYVRFTLSGILYVMNTPQIGYTRFQWRSQAGITTANRHYLYSGTWSQQTPNYTRFIGYYSYEGRRMRYHYMTGEWSRSYQDNQWYDTGWLPAQSSYDYIMINHSRAAPWDFKAFMMASDSNGDDIILHIRPVRIGNVAYVQNVKTGELYTTAGMVAGPDV